MRNHFGMMHGNENGDEQRDEDQGKQQPAGRGAQYGGQKHAHRHRREHAPGWKMLEQAFHRIRFSDTRWMLTAFPLASSTRMSAPCSFTLFRATSKRCGMPVVNFLNTGSSSRPRTPSCGPVKPASLKYAVPLGRICSSAVCTCVCVPTTALTRPSRKR